MSLSKHPAKAALNYGICQTWKDVPPDTLAEGLSATTDFTGKEYLTICFRIAHLELRQYIYSTSHHGFQHSHAYHEAGHCCHSIGTFHNPNTFPIIYRLPNVSLNPTASLNRWIGVQPGSVSSSPFIHQCLPRHEPQTVVLGSSEMASSRGR